MSREISVFENVAEGVGWAWGEHDDIVGLHDVTVVVVIDFPLEAGHFGGGCGCEEEEVGCEEREER